jgi:hypothetical protein
MQAMKTDRWAHDPAEAWLAYEPSGHDPWDRTKVLRMHRRAGLGATWAQIERDLADGYEASVSRLLAGGERGPDGRPGEAIDAFCDAMVESYAANGGSLASVRMAWLTRLVLTAWPLRERMILAWHTHYATGEQRVSDKLSIVTQQRTQRELWREPISKLHLAMLRDAAMLYWLDGDSNLRGTPNENLGREFLELFALGAGNYTEQDVQQAARALTGWQVVPERTPELKYVEGLHDAGSKTILGETGNWTDEDLVRIVSAHPAAARRIAWRLWRTFISNVDEPPPELLEGLAAAIRSGGDVDVARGLETLLRSRLFHSPAYATRSVLSPVEWTVSVLRSGEMFPPHPDLVEVAARVEQMGQTLFSPPNVAGWPGGAEWLTGPGLVARQNFAAWLTSGDAQVAPDHWDQLVAQYNIAPIDRELEFWTALFWGATLDEQHRERLLAALESSDALARPRTVRALLCAPQSQLC